jgi:hypothetical protein
MQPLPLQQGPKKTKKPKISPMLTCRQLSFQKSKGRSLYSDLLPVLEKKQWFKTTNKNATVACCS